MGACWVIATFQAGWNPGDQRNDLRYFDAPISPHRNHHTDIATSIKEMMDQLPLMPLNHAHQEMIS
jgi:hypothetical protein